jgi:hypothetical protein
MKKYLLLLILLAGTFVVGCTPTESASERNRRIAGITNMNMRMAVEDWDHIWLYERSSQLTEWHPHVGY